MPSAAETVIAVVGPTAVGKTEWSLPVAEALDAEIVSVDSRQVYRGLDIGTAKPTPAERARVPHHLLDILAPDQTLGLAEFQRLARGAIAGIHARGRPALLVGGTGQYVWGLLEGWTLPAVAPDLAQRAALEAKAASGGPDALHARLAELDPAAAATIDARNVRRVVRALEVIAATGRPFSDQRRRQAPGYASCVAGLWRPRDELYARIDARVDAMLAAGLLDEVRALAARGYDWSLPALSGVGYRQLGAYLRGDVALDAAVAEIKRATRRYVRTQANWFRRDDPRIRWFQAGRDRPEQLIAAIRAWQAQPAPPAPREGPHAGI
jgi:tRNA dimethylallyltransferase